MVNIAGLEALWNVGGAESVGGRSTSPMVTSMKSTHESAPFKHSVVRLDIAP